MSSSGPTTFGLPPFKLALVAEAIGNIVLIPPLLFYPRTVLSWIFSNPGRDINPGTESLTQLIGALTIALTVPLIVSVPSPDGHNAFRGAAQQRGFRAATYVVLGSTEAALAMVLGSKLFAALRGQDTGLTERMLWIGVGTMMFMLPVRAFFLFARRDLLEERVAHGEKKEL